MFTRRNFLRTAAGAGLAAHMPLWSHASTEFGEFRLDTLSDGYLQLPANFLFGEKPSDEVKAILASNNISGATVQSPCNVTLLRDGTNTILFDAGSGSGFMPSAGDLVDTLDTLGVTPDDITHVIFTHAHPDHLWGVLDDFDDPIFTNASHHIGQAEWDYWINPETVDSIGAERASFAVGAARRLDAIEDAIDFFNPGDEVLPGIMAVDTSGHTPGHMSFEVRSGTTSVMVVGDAIGNGHVAFGMPGLASGSDQDADKGATTRTALLDRLAGDQMAMVGFHLPNGGFGRVERDGDAYRFISEDA